MEGLPHVEVSVDRDIDMFITFLKLAFIFILTSIMMYY